MKVVSIVGMAGAGKSEVARFFERQGFVRVRFGDATDEEVASRGLELNEENERAVRELLRRVHGMAAYAILNLPRIEAARKTSNVVIDGLYSWEEYTFLKDRLGEDMCLVAVWASSATRYARLAGRRVRPLSPEEAASRDRAEIEGLNKGGPIAVADFLIVNEGTRDELLGQAGHVIDSFGGGRWNG